MDKKVLFRSLVPAYLLILAAVIIVSAVGSNALTVISENYIKDTRKYVVIDPGHGGVDGGATSCSGVLESEMNLEIASRLNDLMQLLGYRTLMTRDTDRSIHTEGESIAAQKVSDLKNRVQLVNDTDTLCLLSIHQNFYHDSRYSGAQVFYSSKEGSSSLANTLQSAFIKHLNPGSNRKAKKASGIYIMDKINCTGVLIECGFISNGQEEQRLLSTDYQKKLCCVIAAVCSNHFANTAS